MMEGWSAIDKVMPFTHAVGRVSDGKGSAILIALPEKKSPHSAGGGGNSLKSGSEAETSGERYLKPMGLLLTTSFVMSECETAMDSTVTFMEKPVAGTAIQLGREPRPFSVCVRADQKFVSSVKPKKKLKSWKEKDYSTLPDYILYSELSRMMEEEEGEEEIGYSMVYVDMEPVESSDTFFPSAEGSSGMGSSTQKVKTGHTAAGNPTNAVDGLHLIKPLPLPLLVSRIPPINVGDAHLMVTHINGLEQSYVALKVVAVYPDYCEYESGSILCDFSSGGAVFDMQGNFIGLQHQCNTECIALRTHSIVRHLFQSDLLGLCCCPISDLPLAIMEAGGVSEKQRADMFNEPFGILQSSYLMDVGDKGGHLINYKDIERVRARGEVGSLSPSRVPSFEEVYQEFFSNTFDSLLHMLFAFWYNSPLTRKILDNIIDRKYALRHPEVATAGGIGIIMEVLDSHPEDEALVEKCLAALTLLCLHFSNLSVFIQVNGILTVMEALRMYLHHTTILQWGVHCLMCATDPSQSSAPSKSVDLFLRSNGLELLTYALKRHGRTNSNLCSWIGALLNNVLISNTAYAVLLHQRGLTVGVMPLIVHYRSDRMALNGLIPFFSRVLVLVREYAEEKRKSSSAQDEGSRSTNGGVDTSQLPPPAPFTSPTSDLPTLLAEFLVLASTNEPLLSLLVELCESESILCAATSVALLGHIADIFSVFVYFKTPLRSAWWIVIAETVKRLQQHLPAERELIRRLHTLVESVQQQSVTREHDGSEPPGSFCSLPAS